MRKTFPYIFLVVFGCAACAFAIVVSVQWGVSPAYVSGAAAGPSDYTSRQILWRFETNNVPGAGLTPDTGFWNTNNGNISGAVWTNVAGSSPTQYCFSFDGVDDNIYSIRIATATNWAELTNGMLDFWLGPYTDDNTLHSPVILRGQAPNNNTIFVFYQAQDVGEDRYYWAMHISGVRQYIYRSTVGDLLPASTGQWRHAAVLFDGTNPPSLYINSTNLAWTPDAGPVKTWYFTSNLFSEVAGIVPLIETEKYGGYIDEICVRTNYSPSDVTNIYNNTRPTARIWQ